MIKNIIIEKVQKILLKDKQKIKTDYKILILVIHSYNYSDIKVI